MTATTPPITVPGDKSIAHRALMLAALARGASRLLNVPAGLDVLSTQRVLRALGVTILRQAQDDNGVDELIVHGSGGALVAPGTPIDCGNSGTTIRLLAGVLATRGLTVTLDGDGSLRARPMRRIAAPLAAFGTQIELSPGGTAPFVVHGNAHARGTQVEVVVPSAQVKSAVLFAALGAHGRSRVTGQLATRDHTERLFDAFGIACAADESGALVVDGQVAVLEPKLAQVVTIEQDTAFIGIVKAGKELHQRRLAGAILADERDHLAGVQREGHPTDIVDANQVVMQRPV